MELFIYRLRGKIQASYSWTRDRFVVAPSVAQAVEVFAEVMAYEDKNDARYGCGDQFPLLDSVELIGRVAKVWKPPQVRPHGPSIDELAMAEVNEALT